LTHRRPAQMVGLGQAPEVVLVVAPMLVLVVQLVLVLALVLRPGAVLVAVLVVVLVAMPVANLVLVSMPVLVAMLPHPACPRSLWSRLNPQRWQVVPKGRRPGQG
jgi:hypothetical protein